MPVGAPGQATAQQSFTFNPTRNFVTGEKLYLVIGFGCANFVYTYTGIGPSRPADDVVTVSQVQRKVEVSRAEAGWEPATGA